MKNDPEFNIEFVQLVEKYPVLYNYTLSGYSNKGEVEKAWSDVGAALNETGTACQEKWRILRGGFNRYIKKKEESTSGMPSKKPYYLAKYMEFLIPYLKSRAHNSNVKLAEEYQSESQFEAEALGLDEEIMEKETFFDHCEVVYDEVDDDNEVMNKLYEPEAEVNDKKSFRNKRKDESCIDYVETKRTRCLDTENPDLMFMKSLLPDMALLDKKKKMKFKIEVLNILNNLLYNDAARNID